MWWQDLLWGMWNGETGIILLLLHLFHLLSQYPVYNIVRYNAWYNLGFLLGAGSIFRIVSR